MPSPEAPATLALTASYGGFTLDSTNKVSLQARDEAHRSDMSDRDEVFSIVLAVVVASTGNATTDDGTFATATLALEAALSKKNQRLLVKAGASTLIDWNPSSSARSAFQVRARVAKLGTAFDTNRTRSYRFTVTCRRVGLSALGYRLDADADYLDTFVARRRIPLRGEWSGSSSQTATAIYLANGDTYFESLLPAAVSGGDWKLGPERRQTDEEDASIVVHREYLEHVAGQVAASIEVQTSMMGRRVAILRTSYIATDSATAKAAYLADVDTFWTNNKPTNVTNGEWVEQYETFKPNTDLDTTCESVRTYWEVVNGLRAYRIKVSKNASQRKAVRLSGMFMSTASATAQANYTAYIQTLRGTVLTAIGGRYNTTRPTEHEDDQGETGQTFEWAETFKETVYNEAKGVWDDSNVVDFTLEIMREESGATRTLLPSAAARPQRVLQALYSAAIDKDSTGADDLENLWATKYEALCTDALQRKLKTPNLTILTERLSLSLDGSRIQASLDVVSRLSSVVACTLSEEVREEEGNELVPWADGADFEFYDFDGPPDRTLVRDSEITYDLALASQEPIPFTKEELASGFAFQKTGSFYEQRKKRREGKLVAPCWVPLSVSDRRRPDSMGVDGGRMLNEVTLVHHEVWAWAEKLIPNPKTPNGKTAPRGGAGGGG